jgi:polyisoprenoid-binding protein YceI
MRLPFFALTLTTALLLALPVTAATSTEAPATPVAPVAAPEKPAAEKAATAPTAPKADLSLAMAGTYRLDPSHTNVLFRLAHLGFSGYIGRFNKVEGKVVLDPKDLSKTTLEVTIDANSIDVNHAELEGKLKDAEAFDVANHPSISFKSTKLEQKDANRGTITGDLTLRGMTKPVTLDVILNGVGPHPMNQKTTMGFSATGMIKRSDFGLSKWLPMVGDQVQLIIETEFSLEN